jgi:ribulose-5-phosphate 4-epimerase/fuculose-1-phosphate aldolase
LLDPISAESAAFYKKHALYDTYRNGEGYTLANAIGDNRALLLLNHGVVTVGHSIDEAAWLFLAFERAAQAQLLAQSVGAFQTIPESAAEAIAAFTTPEMAWLNFQPLFQGVIRENQDLRPAAHTILRHMGP